MFDSPLRATAFVALALFCAAGVTTAAKPADVILWEDFEQPHETDFAQKLITHSRIEHAPAGGVAGSAGIRVSYAGYAEGSHRVVVHHPLRQRVEAATLSFDVLFEADFQWTLGGKLHGLGPVRKVTGGKSRVPDGWSARTMFKSDGRISTYTYDQDPSQKWGVGETSAGPVFERERWHRVTLQVQLNTPGEADGFSRILIDGREVVNSTGISFRGIGGNTTSIQQILFSTFHGGNTLRWAPVDDRGKPTTVHARFDNFAVFAGLVSPAASD